MPFKALLPYFQNFKCEKHWIRCQKFHGHNRCWQQESVSLVQKLRSGLRHTLLNTACSATSFCHHSLFSKRNSLFESQGYPFDSLLLCLKTGRFKTSAVFQTHSHEYIFPHSLFLHKHCKLTNVVFGRMISVSFVRTLNLMTWPSLFLKMTSVSANRKSIK